jgi:hypothetical protein
MLLFEQARSQELAGKESTMTIFRPLAILGMVLSLLLGLESSSSPMQQPWCKEHERDGFKVKVCVDTSCQVGMLCPGISYWDLQQWGGSACVSVGNALKGLEKLINAVNKGKANPQELDRSLREAWQFKDKVRDILQKALKRCQEGIWIYCYDLNKPLIPLCWGGKCEEGISGFTCPELYPHSIHLCTYQGAFCKQRDDDKEETVLHELTHLGGSTDDLNDPVNAYNLVRIIYRLVSYLEEVGGDPPIWGNIQAFPTPEYALGRDLNGDGDTFDTVLRYRNLKTGEVINTGLLVSPLYRDIDIYENIIAFAEEGSSAIRYYDITTGSVGDIGIPGRVPSVHKNIIAFVSAGTLHYYDLSTRTLKDTGLRGFSPSVYGDWIAFSLRSSGPFYTIGLYNLRSGTVTDTGVVGQNPSLYGDKIAFETWESDAQEDLNGDGDMNDRVIRYYDVTTQTVINTEAVGQFPALYKDRIAFETKEEAVAQDLNGDGMIRGSVIRYYDLATGQLVNTKELGTEPDIYEDIISFYLWEIWADIDLNGDEDLGDPIVHIYRIPQDTKLGVGGEYRYSGARRWKLFCSKGG